MTNLFERIKQSIAADFHDVIDQKEKRKSGFRFESICARE